MKLPRCYLLVSFPFWNKVAPLLSDNFEREALAVLVDSGAFTTLNSDKVFSLDEYCSFVENLPSFVWKYSSFDVPFNGEETHKNYLTMKSRGLAPCPVFTRGDNNERLDEYLSSGEHTLVGGIAVSNSIKYVRRLMATRIAHAKNIHFFGFTNTKLLNEYRVGSVDCSNWIFYSNLHSLQIYTGKGRIGIWNKRKSAVHGSIPSDVFQRGLDLVGVRLADFRNWDTWTTKRLMMIGARAWMLRMAATERHIGTKVFLACTSPSQASVLAGAYKWLIDSEAWKFV